MKNIILLIVLLGGLNVTELGAVTQDEMEKIVAATVDVIERRPGYVVFDYKKVRMALLSDTHHDRMRIITPITKYSSLDTEQIGKVMQANFHTALDARYASSKDVLYSAFIHSMSVLSEKELLDALDQVAMLALSFGTTYSSSDLHYNGKDR